MSIEEIVLDLKEKIGIDIVLYDGILKKFKNKEFFDIELSEPSWMSKDFAILIRYSSQYKVFNVEETGYKRVGLFFKKGTINSN